MPSPLPYMQHYHRDWMSSSTVQLMSVTAEGIFFRLCMVQWEDGSLPSSPDKLKRLSRADSEEWAKFEEFLEECFPESDNVRKNPRVDRDRVQALENLAKKSQGGRATAEKRWGGKNEAELPNENSIAISEQQDSNSLATAKPYSSSLPTKEERESAGATFSGAGAWRPPSPMEVCEYMTLRGISDPASQAEKFIAHYGRTRWQTRNGLLTDWKAAVDGWQARDGPPGKPPPKPKETLEEATERRYQDAIRTT